MGWNLPPGCSVNDIPGNRPEDDDDLVESLVEWFKETYADRTPPKSVQDAHPDYRVTWHETRAKMISLGFTGDVHDRIVWARIFVRYKLRAWANRLIKKTGSTTLMSKESDCSKATRQAYGE